jgi:two-component system, NarL family, nitrate/nitrite response regulator NarL
MLFDLAPLRLLAVTDEPVLAIGVERLLAAHHAFIVATAVDLDEAAAEIQRRPAHIILLDANLCGTAEVPRRLRRQAPESRIALWAHSFPEELVVQARESGIEGFVPRTATPAEFLLELNRLTATGHTSPIRVPKGTVVRLSPRESQLTGLLTQGMKNAEIAASLGLSEGTVKAYVVRLLRKTGARDRFELAILGLKNTWSGQAIWDGPNGCVRARDEERSRPLLRTLMVNRAGSA